MGFYVSDPMFGPPETTKTPLEQLVYELLERLTISYRRVACQAAITMDDCRYIDSALDARTVKTILLCNRQQTRFYLLVMRGDKTFVTRQFSQALGVSRVSFAPAEVLQQRMGTEVGGATLFSYLLPTAQGVRLVIDREVIQQTDYCGTDGTPECYVKFATADLVDKIIPAIYPEAPDIIDLEG